MDGYDTATYGDRFADVYDDWYDDPAATDAGGPGASPRSGRESTAGCLRCSSCGGGRRTPACPSPRAGMAVTGLDASAAMLERLAAKQEQQAVATVVGDMAGPLPDGPFDLVLVARNTLFNLTTEAAQRACLAEVGRVLAPAGRLVVEAFVPADEEGPTSSVGGPQHQRRPRPPVRRPPRLHRR